MNKTLFLVSSLGLGAGLMYLCDPEKGPRRRQMVRAQAQTYRRWSDDLLGQTRRTLDEHRHHLRRQARTLNRQARTVNRQARTLGEHTWELLG